MKLQDVVDAIEALRVKIVAAITSKAALVAENTALKARVAELEAQVDQVPQEIVDALATLTAEINAL